MNFVRSATIAEVLRATPDDEPTRDVVRARPQFGVWAFDSEDIGGVGAQLPSGTMGTISSLLGEWKTWLGSTDPQAVGSAAAHEAFTQTLRSGNSFAVRPIVIGPTMQIHDGRHRLFAAFEFLGERGNERTFEVLWDRVP
jgi:hypothetical protein